MSASGVHVEFDSRAEGGRVATVTVDAQHRLNVLDTPRIEALTAAFAACTGDETLRAVVLTGAGEKAFIGGADLNELGALTPETARTFITKLHGVCAAIRACPVPVIARIQGYCLGAGLEIAASCDMRVAGATAQFGMPEVKIGLPSVIEAALLPGLIGWGRARMFLMTGNMVGAEQALAMGLIERLASDGDLDDALGEWLDALCAAGPAAIRSQKALMRTWEQVSIDQGIAAGIDALVAAYETPEPTERIAQFFANKAKAKKS